MELCGSYGKSLLSLNFNARNIENKIKSWKSVKLLLKKKARGNAAVYILGVVFFQHLGETFSLE